VEEALRAVADRGMSIRQAAVMLHIPRKTLGNKFAGKHMKSVGHPTALSLADEKEILHQILVCADWGMPLSSLEVRLIVRDYLLRCGRIVKNFKGGSLPGEDWYSSFVKRHREDLTVRKCQNISRARATVGIDELKAYFDHLESVLQGVPPENILNYDETNLSDDPGSKRMVFRRGVKYPERVMNSTKGCISIMFSASASGDLLPCYVVYRAECMWTSWVEGGPPGTFYGRTKSGWFDGPNFEEWFMKIVVPWAKRRSGVKCMIGDNLSSHISREVVRVCEEQNIKFILLPPNATHLCQPLDVAVFGPLKRVWRTVLEDYKIKNSRSSSLEKSRFPRLLTQLLEEISEKVGENIRAGFKKCGIFPCDRLKVLQRIPGAVAGEQQDVAERRARVSDTLLAYLQECRTPQQQRRIARKKVSLPPGKAITSADLDVHTLDPKNDGPSTSGLGGSRKRQWSGTSSSSEDDPDFSTHDSTSSGEESLMEKEENTQTGEMPLDLQTGDFVIVKMPGKKSIKHFMAKIINICEDGDLEISCLRTRNKGQSFTFPNLEDECSISPNEVALKLSAPREHRGKFIFSEDVFRFFQTV
jgi:hypothetical protein